MFNLTEWKQTKFYQEAKKEGTIEGKIEGKMETIPLLVRLGLNEEQIARELNLKVEKRKQRDAAGTKGCSGNKGM